MGRNSLPKAVTRQRRDCDLYPGPTAPESSTLTARLASHLVNKDYRIRRSSSTKFDGAGVWVASFSAAERRTRKRNNSVLRIDLTRPRDSSSPQYGVSVSDSKKGAKTR